MFSISCIAGLPVGPTSSAKAPWPLQFMTLFILNVLMLDSVMTGCEHWIAHMMYTMS